MQAEARVCSRMPDMSDLRLDLRATPEAVRLALGQLMAEPALARLGDDLRGTLEIVLAEVLNNVVEHAYACAEGWVSLRLTCAPDRIQAEVSDSGCPMPGLCPPAGRPADLGGDLPEGGFGWFLIRSLTRDLQYEHRAGRNMLRFVIPAG